MNIESSLNLIFKISEKYKMNKPYLVGGAVRDFILLGRSETSDLDITTNSSDSLRLGLMFASHSNMSFNISPKKNVTVYSESVDIDFSSHFISPSVINFIGERNADSESMSRDFTINTIQQDLITRKLRDPTGSGVKDAKAKLLKTPVPALITLNDDPRRAFRAINLAARYDLTIDEEIIEFCKENKDLFRTVPEQFIFVKMVKAIEANPSKTVELLIDTGLFGLVPLRGDFKKIVMNKNLINKYLDSSNGS
jgi:tRNA nucleotidyltransferase/poly(A) polymerase